MNILLCIRYSYKHLRLFLFVTVITFPVMEQLSLHPIFSFYLSYWKDGNVKWIELFWFLIPSQIDIVYVKLSTLYYYQNERKEHKFIFIV